MSICTEFMEREIKERDDAIEVDKKSLQFTQPDVRMDWRESVWAFLQAGNHIIHGAEHDPKPDENPVLALGRSREAAVKQADGSNWDIDSFS